MSKLLMVVTGLFATLLALPGSQETGTRNQESYSTPASQSPTTRADVVGSINSQSVAPAAVNSYGLANSGLLTALPPTGFAQTIHAYQAVNSEDQKQQAAYAQAIRSYREANADDQKSAARNQIREQLAKQYDELLSRQDKQISELEERVVKLKEQLARRREAKSRMVELKLEMVVSQADGLGWPENEHLLQDPFRVRYFGSQLQPLETITTDAVLSPFSTAPPQAEPAGGAGLAAPAPSNGGR